MGTDDFYYAFYRCLQHKFNAFFNSKKYYPIKNCSKIRNDFLNLQESGNCFKWQANQQFFNVRISKERNECQKMSKH